MNLSTIVSKVARRVAAFGTALERGRDGMWHHEITDVTRKEQGVLNIVTVDIFHVPWHARKNFC